MEKRNVTVGLKELGRGKFEVQLRSADGRSRSERVTVIHKEKRGRTTATINGGSFTNEERPAVVRSFTTHLHGVEVVFSAGGRSNRVAAAVVVPSSPPTTPAAQGATPVATGKSDTEPFTPTPVVERELPYAPPEWARGRQSIGSVPRIDSPSCFLVALGDEAPEDSDDTPPVGRLLLRLCEQWGSGAPLVLRPGS